MEDEPLIGTSTLRGIILLAGVGAVAYIAFKMYMKVKAKEHSQIRNISIPVNLPTVAQRTPQVKK